MDDDLLGLVLNPAPGLRAFRCWRRVCTQWKGILQAVRGGSLTLQGADALRKLQQCARWSVLELALRDCWADMQLSCLSVQSLRVVHCGRLCSLPSSLVELSVTGAASLTAPRLEQLLQACHSLRQLTLQECHLLMDLAPAMCHPPLTHLRVWRAASDQHMHVSRPMCCPDLQVLELGVSLTIQGLAHLILGLRSCHLRQLLLNQVGLNGHGWSLALEPSSKASGVQHLDLCDCVGLTDSNLAVVAQMPQLHTLHLSGCVSVGAAGLAHLSKSGCNTGTGASTSLRQLRLDRCIKVDDVAMWNLAKLCNLTAVAINGCFRVSDIGMVRLAFRCPGLVAVEALGCVRLTEVSLRALLRYCSGLRTLKIRGCSMAHASDLSKRLSSQM